MTIRPSYARFYASKWRSGTLMLSLEEEGLYIRVSAFQMECGQPLPEDWKDAAKLLCVQPLKYRKTIDALLSKGKLISTAEGIICERAMLEYRRAQKGIEGDKQDPPTNPPTNPGTYPDTNPGTMGVEAEKDESNQAQFDNRREEEEKKIITTVLPSTPRVEKPIGRPGMDFWAKALNPPVEPAHQTVTLSEDGQIILHNGTRAKWLAKFGGDAERLDLALTQAAGWVQPHSSRPLPAQVEAQLARAAAEKIDKDQRYERAAAKSAPVGNGSNILAHLDSRKGVPA